jgi:hypothetical protein
MNAAVTPADLVAECLTGSVRRLIGGVHSLTSARVVVVCADEQWVRVRFSASPGVLPAPWDLEDSGWARAPRGAEPGLRDASADPVLVVVGVAESQVVAVNALAVDEIGVTCTGRDGLIANWLLQAQVQGAFGDIGSLAGALLSDNPDATVVVADPMTGERGWVDVLATGTAWPVRPLKTPSADPAEPSTAPESTAADPVTPPTPEEAPASDPQPQRTPAPAGPSGGRMHIFGVFEVLDDAGAPLQPMQRDLVGGIYFNQPIGIYDLCERLFGTSERPASFHVAMSKMRRRGLHPVHIDGFYTIDIASDWRKFTDLTGSDPAAANTPSLAAAAAMINGPLFGATPPQWATPLLAPMRTTVSAVCRELATRHADQPAVALGYARQGLAVDPDNPELSAIIDTLAGQSGQSC